MALPGLALAQGGSRARDALAFERLEAIHELIGVLITQLAPLARPAAVGLPAAAWQEDGAILCLPGRGQLDDLAATMAIQILVGAGFGARQEPNLILGAADTPERLSRVRLCFLSVLEEGSSASSIRYFTRRIQKKMPEAAVVICLWHAPGDSALLAALRASGEKEHLVLSISELVALAHALSARASSWG